MLVPPNFDPQPGFPEARAIGAALRAGTAQASQTNLLTWHTIIEQALGDLQVPVTFLRPA